MFDDPVADLQVPPKVEIADAVFVIHTRLGHPDEHSTEGEEAHETLPEQSFDFLYRVHDWNTSAC
jgi:hypothetical protein